MSAGRTVSTGGRHSEMEEGRKEEDSPEFKNVIKGTESQFLSKNNDDKKR